MKIRDHVHVTPQPTVVRLEHLQEPGSEWISQRYFITGEAEGYFKAIRKILSKAAGCGMFLIGHYGSGKSHFLAYLAQQIQAGSFLTKKVEVQPISLLHYKSSEPLEMIVGENLAIDSRPADRRKAWTAISKKHSGGLLLLIDELSEFLRSKPTAQSFNEDLRFLQFLGEWSQAHPLWLLAALQEQIEHTGDIEYDLYRKIKDRYPMRFLISPAHVRDLIAQKLLSKEPSYATAVEGLVSDWREIYPASSMDYAELSEVYPIHPATMQLLEEVRDRFSQARGIIDFALTRLLGNDARGIEPFLDQPWGRMITPDLIVDHFSDLFEIQPEFLPIAQKLLPYFRKQIPVLYENKSQQELAWRILKLLILVHLSPRRSSLSPEEAAQWLLLSVSKIEPARNYEVIKKMLDAMVANGAFLKRKGSRYMLDLEDDGKENWDHLVAKAIEELKGQGDALFESLLPLLRQGDFDLFALPRDRWHIRKIQWFFHERDVNVYFGAGLAPEQSEPALQVGLPWGPPAGDSRCYRVLPAHFEITPDILELAALCRLKERVLPSKLMSKVDERIAARSSWLCSLFRSAYSDAAIFDAHGARLTPLQNPVQAGYARWINNYCEWVLRQTYPAFESLAPSHGPLSREAYRQFMKYAVESDLCSEDAPEAVKLIREAYLVPMGLMQRRGTSYIFNMKLENHELVGLLSPIIEHHPSPARIYQHLSAPVYGLVPDQIHLLLLTLLIQGEIDIVKGQSSYRETYDTLPNPLQYDKIIPGKALRLDQIKDLQTFCDSFRIPSPRQWTVLAQKRAIEQLRRSGSRQRDTLSEFVMRLRAQPQMEELAGRIQHHISQWLALDKGDNELQGFQHFQFAVGAPKLFMAEALELASLPARFDKLLREAQRYQHLFSYPCISSNPNADVAVSLEAMGPCPSLAEPEGLERWLERARLAYDKYRSWYSVEHDRCLATVQKHRIWSYHLPGIARSKHASVTAAAHELEALQSRAKSQRCGGLSPLDFQPICRCGFDGQQSPLFDVLHQFDDQLARMESDLALFFQQDKVKRKIQEWVDQRIEVNSRSLSYLEGAAPFPEVENLPLFDQLLSGIELVREIKAEDLLDLLGQQTWEKAALMKALDQFFSSHGPRVVLHREDSAPKSELVAWCSEQALRQGCPLPKGFTAAEIKMIPAALQPAWVSEASLRQLENLGLGEGGIDQICRWLLDGKIQQPLSTPQSGIMAAAMELINPTPLNSPEELARKAALLYRNHERFLRLRPEPWLSLLDKLAHASLSAPVMQLMEALRSHAGDQWIVIDALGLPLFQVAQEAIARSFNQWQVLAPDYVWTGDRSGTDDFYQLMLAEGVGRSFEKANAIDELIHRRRLNLDELGALAKLELEIAFKRILSQLNPRLPVVLFGDHGFRLSSDGQRFAHGGNSTLERLTLLFRLVPNEA